MDHHWVAKAWLSDVGLPQYSQAFHNHLVDGRLLNSLTRRDLERHLNITKKFHQALQARRIQCEHQNVDPLVWTSHRVMKWIKDIDLKEFAESLLSSGVHGAVMVLDPTFNTDAMATALGIPSNKHMVRRHLVEEMKTLIRFSPKARNGRDLSCHSSYGSLPREGRDQTPPRAEGSPIHGYTSIEVTNV
uniref:SAM domain-containing protein n=1 Tax=Cyclopterus lumpus TaxID=8103 RepID=A0A8C2X160_CYCLU